MQQATFQNQLVIKHQFGEAFEYEIIWFIEKLCKYLEM